MYRQHAAFTCFVPPVVKHVCACLFNRVNKYRYHLSTYSYIKSTFRVRIMRTACSMYRLSPLSLSACKLQFAHILLSRSSEHRVCVVVKLFLIQSCSAQAVYILL